jgi:hypothetical protein
MSKCWYSILETNLALLKAIPEGAEEREKVQSLINPQIIFELLVTDITQDYSIPACNILSLIIEDEPSILESLNLEHLCGALEKSYNSLPFAKRSGIMRLSFSIMEQNKPEFTFFLMEKEIVQSFPPLLDSLDDCMKKKSVNALTRGIESLGFQPKKYHGLVDILSDEYAELLSDWMQSDDDELSELASTMSSFLEDQRQ